MFRVVPIRGVSHFTGGFLLQHMMIGSLNTTVSSGEATRHSSSRVSLVENRACDSGCHLYTTRGEQWILCTYWGVSIVTFEST